MAESVSYRPAPGSVPDAPGVYRFRDEHGVVIYVGKARSLRNRLNSYFGDLGTLHTRTRVMVTTAKSLDWVTVANEVEALQVEYEWIKRYDPRFNVRYRDDKSYPYLAVTLNEEYPRIQVVRGAKKKGVRYFGPYAHAWAIRETVDQLLKVFPMRSCSKGVFERHLRIGRPCLLHDLGKCAAPCVGEVTVAEHREIADSLCEFVGGDPTRYLADVEKRMLAAAESLDFERAARLRDDLAALRRALERSAVVLPDSTDADFVGVADDVLEACVQVFHVRAGRVVGQRSYIVEKSVEQEASALVEQFVVLLFGEIDPTDGRSIPKEILVSEPVTNSLALGKWLTDLRGSQVKVSSPLRGARRSLMMTVVDNAQQALTIHKLRRAGDLTARSKALQELQDVLGLHDAPLRIECIDISGQQQKDQTASIVVFEDGLPKKSHYRTYKIDDDLDDLSAMYDAVVRRFGSRAERSTTAGETGAARYRTSLLVVDGAAGQVKAAQQALTDVGVSNVAVCGLAKRLEEVWVVDQPDPVIFARRSEGLYLLQRIRDEAHRFAVNFHRKRKSKRARASALDAISGLGPVKRRALLKHFGSVRRIRAASVAELAAVDGIGPTLAEVVAQSLAQRPDNEAVNAETGEIVSS